MSLSEYEYFCVSTSGGDGLKEGVYLDVPFEEYKAIDALNNSSLSHLARSYKHFRHQQETRREKQSAALRFGTLAHAGVLEPERLLELYCILPDFTEGIDSKNPRATKEYKTKVKAWEQKHKNLTAITPQEYDRMLGVSQSIHSDAVARAAFQDGKAEVTLIWRDPLLGRMCKARPDYVKAEVNLICDLKTTRDAADFERAIANYGYDRQAAFYLRGAQILGYDMESFFFVAVETEPPYGVRAAPLDKDTLEDGRKQIEQLLAELAECELKDTQSGYKHPDTFAKPKWAFKFKTAAEQRQMSVGGVLVDI